MAAADAFATGAIPISSEPESSSFVIGTDSLPSRSDAKIPDTQIAASAHADR